MATRLIKVNADFPVDIPYSKCWGHVLYHGVGVDTYGTDVFWCSTLKLLGC